MPLRGKTLLPGRPWWALHPAVVVVVGVAALLWSEAMRAGINTDAFWQMAAGRWMLAHHAVIRSDTFSYTVRGRPWLAEEWGFELALAWVVREIGGAGYWLMAAGPCVVALLLGVARWRRAGAGWLWVAVLSTVVGLSLGVGVAPRPQTFSYAFLAGELLVLQLARRRPAWLGALPPLLLVWANVHGSFLVGLAVIALEAGLAIGPVRRRLSRGRLAVSRPLPLRPAVAVLAASLAATLVNPHGPRLLSYAYHVSSAPQLTGLIQEWQSPDFHSLLLLALVAGTALVVVAALALTEATVEVFDLLLWAGLGLATLHAQRFLPYLGLAWAGLAAGFGVLRTDRLPRSVLVGPVAAVLAGLVLAAPHPPAGTPSATGPLAVPVAAVRRLGPPPVGGRVFSTYAWNDYLIARGIPVFVDGRTDLYFGSGILEQYVQVADVSVDPDTVLDRWSVRYVLWPPGSSLSVFLAHDPAWRQVYRSPRAVIFERR